MTDETYREMFPTSSQRGKDNDEKYSKYSTEEIIDAYRKQSVSVFPTIEVFVECEISDQNDYILEGYHIESAVIEKLNRKYPGKIRSIVLVKTDPAKFLEDLRRSTTPNDWILARTHQEETFEKIAKMICDYGKITENEAKIYGVRVLHTDVDFN